MLKQRVLTSAIVIPVIVLAVWFGAPWLPILAAIVGIIGITEFYRLTGVNKVVPMAACGTVLTILFIIYPQFHFNFQIQPVSVLLTAAIALPLVLMIFLPKQEGLFRMWAWTLTGVLYIGWLISYIVAIRVDAGRNWLFLMFFCTFGSDITAYFVGKAIGKHKMAPSISPKKSWEGAIFGFIFAVVAMIAAKLFLLKFIQWQDAIVIGVIVGILGQIGDLSESLLKRDAGVKDSSNLIPGHGGIFDRFDSFIAVSPVIYLYLKYFVTK